MKKIAFKLNEKNPYTKFNCNYKEEKIIKKCKIQEKLPLDSRMLKNDRFDNKTTIIFFYLI